MSDGTNRRKKLTVEGASPKDPSAGRKNEWKTTVVMQIIWSSLAGILVLAETCIGLDDQKVSQGFLQPLAVNR